MPGNQKKKKNGGGRGGGVNGGRPGRGRGGTVRVPRKERDVVDSVAHASGARGTDVRSPVYSKQRLGEGVIAAPQQDPTLNAKILIDSRSIAYMAMGIVLRALKHGWLGGPQVADVEPYYAWRYLMETFKTAVEGAVPQLQSAPLWLWEILAAFNPKTESFKTSLVTYTGSVVDDGLGTDVAFALGTDEEAYTLFWGTASTTTIMDWAVLDAPAPYTVDSGSKSVQNLFEFFRNDGLNKRMGAPDPKSLFMTHDTSAFSAVWSELGASYGNPAGGSVETYSERPINAPIFAKFANYQAAGDEFYWRGYYHFRKSAGSPCYIGPRLSEMAVQKEIMNKCPPIFKFVNFDEIYEVFALHLGMAMDRYQQAGQAYVPCPLTPQEFQILLRQNLLPYFANDMAQDIRLQEQASWVTFLPFVVGPNGVPSGVNNTNMLFPMPLAENIRSLRRITAQLNNRFGQNVIDIVPILGRPSPSDTPQLGNYLTQVGGHVFNTTPDSFEVNLIDASVVDSGTTKYLSLTGLALNLLATAFNEWYNKISGATASQVMIASEPGPSILSSLIYTNHYRQTPNIDSEPLTTALLSKRKSKDYHKSDGPPAKVAGLKGGEKSKGIGPTRFRTEKVGVQPIDGESDAFILTAHTLVTATLGFPTPIYKYISMFVLPCAYTVTSALESSVPALQANWVEPFSMNVTANPSAFPLLLGQVNYPSMYEKHYQFATACTKAWNAPGKTEVELELEEMGKKGEGGFLGNLASTIAGAFGWEDGAKIAKKVGDITGL